MARVRISRLAAAGTLGLIFLVLAATALAFDPLTEQRNFQKINERNQLITLTPAFQAKLQAQNVRDSADLALLLAGDPERNPLQNVCVQRKNECAGDVRFYDWGQEFGVAQPVLYTARNGATISGTIWITQEGPARRPAIVITTGSVQAPETLYWGLAATFAKHGYVVLTYDVQGQGRSDTNGEGADSQEGFPSQAGQPFYDGTEDALDFMLSSAASPYTPRPSCGNANSGTGTSHAAKQQRRVRAGLNTGFNPFASLIDPARVGIAGHSLGAGAVSFVGQKDPRVDAIVAWDNLRAPETASACPSAPGTRTPPPITKPALGFSNDYGLTQQPFTSDPPRDRHNEAFAAYRDAGVDSMQINIRGGTHFEYSFLPGNTAPIPLGAATWRGMDLAAWYTVAWFDRYVKGGDPAALAAAESRLLTDRWCDDLPTKGIDQASDGNMFSFYFDSPVDFARAAGGRAQITDLREACGGPSLAPDGAPVPYDFLADSMRPATPGPGPAPGSGGPDSGSRFKCRATRRVRGTRRADRLRGTPRAERIRALRGADLIAARAGADCALGGRGRDRAFGGPGNDLVRGGAAADALRGSRGRDVVAGDAGRDRIRGGRGNDVLLGGGGRDRIRSRDGRVDVIACGPGADLIIADRADQRSGCERALRG